MTAGEVLQLPDGRAGYIPALNPPDSGDVGCVQTAGLVTVAKIATKATIKGCKMFFDRSASTASPIETADSFYIGTAFEDKAASATTVIVDLNVQPSYIFELGRPGDLITNVATKTAGSPALTYDVSNFWKLLITNNDEAQCVDILSNKSVPLADGPIFEAQINIQEKGDNAAVDIVFGLANASHTSNPDTITESAFFSINGDAAHINAESDDGTAAEVAATDTTIDLTEGTMLEFWIDARDPAAVDFYIDGVQVLSSTTFDIGDATGPLKALVLVEKSGGAHVPDIRVQSLRLRSCDI